jgi:hypothetical protein
MMVSSILFTMCFCLWFVHGTFIEAFSFSKPTAYRSAHPKINIDYRSRHSIKQQSTSCKSSSTGSTSDTESSNTSITPKVISSHAYSHHIAIKTRNINIRNAIDFYSLLGFCVPCHGFDKTQGIAGIESLCFGCDAQHSPNGGCSPPGTACELYQLKEWMDDLNQLWIEKFRKSLQIALPLTKRMIGREVYEMVFS